jgi:hypothetical protein
MVHLKRNMEIIYTSLKGQQKTVLAQIVGRCVLVPSEKHNIYKLQQVCQAAFALH